jgi:hypothetical protein
VRVLVRALTVSVMALGLAWMATAATDEGGVSWGERAGRTLPLTPVCAAIGVWVALAPARARGEALALGALGRSRGQIAAAAVAGGALVACGAAVAIGMARTVDVTPFFPRAAQTSTWAWQEGTFVDRVQGLLVGADGAPVGLTPDAWGSSGSIPRFGRTAAGMAVATAGLAVPMIVAHALLAESEETRRLAAVSMLASAAAGLASIILFQAAAAGHVSSLLAGVPPIVLLAFAMQRYRGSA